MTKRKRPKDPIGFKLLEVEPGFFEIYRGRVLLNRRPFTPRKAATIVYLLAEEDDLIMIHALGQDKRGIDGRDFKNNEEALQHATWTDRDHLGGMRFGGWLAILAELGLRDNP